MKVVNFPRSKIYIVGVCRDVATTLLKEIENLEKLFENSIISFYVVESDSSDNTLEILEKIAGLKRNFNFTTAGALLERIPLRTNRIAYCRNLYMEYLENVAHDQDLVVIADLDGANKDLTNARFNSILQRDDWDVCTANQKFAYFDIWALRKDGWSNGDWMSEYRELDASGLKPSTALRTALYSKMKKIDEREPWIPVNSAFGGLGVYKFQIIRGLRYQGELEGIPVCEHVPFNLDIRKRNGRLYIVPGLINCDMSPHTAILKKKIKLKTFVVRKISQLANSKKDY